MIRTMIGAIALTVTALPATAADFYIYGGASKHFATADFDGSTGEVDVEDAYGGALAFGWDFAQGSALEIMLDGAAGQEEGNGRDVAAGALSLNVYYAPRHGVIQPRLGVGFGVEAIDEEGASEDPEAGFMVQGSAGVFFWIGDHFALGPTYRYRYTDAPINGEDADTTDHIAELGAKVSF